MKEQRTDSVFVQRIRMTCPPSIIQSTNGKFFGNSRMFEKFECILAPESRKTFNAILLSKLNIVPINSDAVDNWICQMVEVACSELLTDGQINEDILRFFKWDRENITPTQLVTAFVAHSVQDLTAQPEIEPALLNHISTNLEKVIRDAFTPPKNEGLFSYVGSLLSASKDAHPAIAAAVVLTMAVAGFYFGNSDVKPPSPRH